MSDVQCEKPFKGFLNYKNADATHFLRCALLLFAIHINSPLPPVSFSPPCVTHSYCKCLQSCCQGCNQIQSSYQTNWMHGKEKVRKSCLKQNRSNNHGCQVQVGNTPRNRSLGLEGCFVHYKICKLYTFRATRFKDLSFIVCFTFYFLKNDWKMTKKKKSWEPRGSWDSP